MKKNNQHHKNLLEVLKYQRWEFLLSQLPIARDIEKLWLQGKCMLLKMRQVSNKNLLAVCSHPRTRTIAITSDVLDFLGYEGPLRSKLGRGKKPSKKK